MIMVREGERPQPTEAEANRMSRPRNKNTAAEAKPRGQRVSISITLVRKMLPLVSQIIREIHERWNRLSDLESEQIDLDRRRRSLSWPERSRRYQISEEIASEQHHLQQAVAELEQLDVVLVDAIQGEVAFPTTLSGRRGYYIWRLGSPDVGWWCYAHDPTRHPIQSA
jgi:hypothetical protein